jgi:hypothetical protein
MAQTPSVRNTTQAGENVRKISFLNYESGALSAGATGAELGQIPGWIERLFTFQHVGDLPSFINTASIGVFGS